MQGKETLIKDLAVDDSQVILADVVKDDLTEKFQGSDALIVATSAKPELIWSSMPGFFWKRFLQKETGIMPGFTFAQSPEQVGVSCACRCTHVVVHAGSLVARGAEQREQESSKLFETSIVWHTGKRTCPRGCATGTPQTHHRHTTHTSLSLIHI